MHLPKKQQTACFQLKCVVLNQIEVACVSVTSLLEKGLGLVKLDCQVNCRKLYLYRTFQKWTAKRIALTGSKGGSVKV